MSDVNKNNESQDLGTIVANPVTEKILSRYITVDKTIQESNVGDQSVNDNSAVLENKQDDSSNVLSDAEINNLLDAGITGDQLEGKTVDEIKSLIKKDETQQVNTQEQIIITEAMVQPHGFAKNLIGKPISEAFKAIDEQNRYITELKSKETAKPVEPEQKIINKTENKTDASSINIEPIDFVNLTPEEQSKKIVEIAEKIADEKLAKLQVSQQPTPEQIQKSVNEFTKNFNDALQKGLPNGVSANIVFAEWKKNNKTSPELQDAYIADPNSLITVILNDYRVKNMSNEQIKKNQESKDNEVKMRLESAKRIKEALANLQNQGTGAKFNFPREHKTTSASSDIFSEEGTESEKMIGNILKRHLNK